MCPEKTTFQMATFVTPVLPDLLLQVEPQVEAAHQVQVALLTHPPPFVWVPIPRCFEFQVQASLPARFTLLVLRLVLR